MSADGTHRDGNATENIQSVQQILHSQSKKERKKERKHEFSYIQLKSNMKSSTRSIYFYNHFKVPLIVF